MKVLQTLGRHGGMQEGVFQYKRTPNGLSISTFTAATQAPIEITNEEWQAILEAIDNATGSSFRLTVPGVTSTNPPYQSLYTLFSTAVPTPVGGWNWSDSYRSYIAAILEHEGSIDLYAGALGPQNPPAVICLAKDF